MLGDEQFGPLAAEVICAIAGLPIDEDDYWRPPVSPTDDPDVALPPLEQDDLNANLVPDGEDALPVPEPEAIAAWWQARRGDYDPGIRYLGGRPLSGEVLSDALRYGPMRRRHAHALELAMRSGGAGFVNTRALCREQQAQIEAVAGLADLDCQRGRAIG